MYLGRRVKARPEREFICRKAEVKLPLIVLRTCTCGVISHLYRNKLDVTERREGGPGGEGPLGAPPPTPLGPVKELFSGGFSAAYRGTIKCNFTAASQAGKGAFSAYFR